ncbi:MAG: transposase, partial [Acidobacteria bacterium]|nr:transposase [Acidobacteriota bacterium]
VTTWLRAVGIADDFADYYYFLQPLGRKSKELAQRLLGLLLVRLVTGERVLLAVDDSPTKRYGPHVQGAGIHHNPTPGPADQKFLYGHIWVTISLVLRHPLWQTIGLPLLGLLYVRAKDIVKIPRQHRWQFRTKLQLAAGALRQFAELVKAAGMALWVVADGAYAKRRFLRPLRMLGVTVVSRLRRDAALYTLPPVPKTRRRGRPRIYGTQRMHLGRRAAQPGGWQQVQCFAYGRLVTKTIKTFLATYPPAGGVIRVVIVKEDDGCQFFFSTNPEATPREIVETFADRAAIEQDFHDVKEVWGAGQQQVRNIWTNVATFNLNLWVHTLVECWAWNKPAAELCDRSRPPLRGGARRGTTPQGDRLTPIAAKPCAARRCTTNIRRTPPPIASPQKSAPSTNAYSNLRHNAARFSESAVGMTGIVISISLLIGI